MDPKNPMKLNFDAKKSEMEPIMTEKAQEWMKFYEKYPPTNFYSMIEKCPEFGDQMDKIKSEL